MYNVQSYITSSTINLARMYDSMLQYTCNWWSVQFAETEAPVLVSGGQFSWGDEALQRPTLNKYICI